MIGTLTRTKKKFVAYYERNGYPTYIFDDTPEEWEYFHEYNNEHDSWDALYAEQLPDGETIESLRQLWEDDFLVELEPEEYNAF